MGLVVAPWCVYIGQKIPRQRLQTSLGVICGWMEFATPATYSVIVSHLLGDFNIDGNRMNSSGVSSAVYWALSLACVATLGGIGGVEAVS